MTLIGFIGTAALALLGLILLPLGLFRIMVSALSSTGRLEKLKGVKSGMTMLWIGVVLLVGSVACLPGGPSGQADRLSAWTANVIGQAASAK